MDKILAALLIILLVGCKITKDVSGINNKDEADISVLESNSLFEKLAGLEKDTIFNCLPEYKDGGILYSYKKPGIDMDNQVFSKAKCFCKDALEGQKSAIEVLQLIHLNHKRMLCEKYRGAFFFEIVLARSADFERLDAPGSPHDGLTSFQTSYRERLYEMIKSIDGYFPTVYYTIYLHKVKGMSNADQANIMDNDKVTWAKLEYEAIKYAWENDLIILKDYSEE